MTVQRITIATVLAVVATGTVLSALVLSLLFTSQTINNTGNIKTIGIGVYSNPECTNTLPSINWDLLERGTTKNVTIYIRNNGTVPVELNMTTDNWSPTTIKQYNYMTLGWNCSSYILAKESVVPALLTLTVYSNITGIQNFSFDIILSGTEHL